MVLEPSFLLNFSKMKCEDHKSILGAHRLGCTSTGMSPPHWLVRSSRPCIWNEVQRSLLNAACVQNGDFRSSFLQKCSSCSRSSSKLFRHGSCLGCGMVQVCAGAILRSPRRTKPGFKPKIAVNLPQDIWSTRQWLSRAGVCVFLLTTRYIKILQLALAWICRMKPN